MILVGVSLSVLVLAGCKPIPPPTPLAQLNEQQAHGHDVFQSHCGSCHNDRRNGALNGPSLRGTFKKEYLPSGAPANDERVVSTIRFGRGMMPPMAGTMDSGDLDDLMAYLHTL
ncbi:c-type cytochrome [Granulicella arctica]|uniref:c-type cytochrome n=1 Tax=Granulicella arctica TaxID=940613 RepID=UPI0021DF9B87|nr:cytochrome c [Granulicella arctica]